MMTDEASGGARAKTRKAPTAFRTISEVADDLHIPQHVLRFWETKFPQVHPLKRGGGRRYYRPEDISLLRRISDLLYIQGYTIKGVQRLLREGGGKLSGDIPPAPPDEQAASAAERRQLTSEPLPELPMPGLEPRPHNRDEPHRAAMVKLVVKQNLEQDTEKLRALLTDVLHELEALRAMLP